MTHDEPKENPYTGVVILNYNEELNFKPMPIGWYSLFGGELNGHKIEAPKLSFKDKLWGKVHDIIKDKGYCDEEGCC